MPAVRAVPAAGPDRRLALTPLWRGKRVLLVAGGPSVSGASVARWRQACDIVAVVNNGLYLAPDADLLWFTDRAWYREHADEVRRFAGQRATLENYDLQAELPGLWCLHNMGERGFYPHPDGVKHGSNGGYALLHLAAHLGIREAVLLGYDCRRGPQGWHWHGDHPAPLHNPSFARADIWQRNFAELAPVLAARGISVVNASPVSALTCFRRPEEACAPSA